MSKRVRCKFFAHGACLKGEHCLFSHDERDPSNNVCTYFQKGACLYGSRCRYEHVKAFQSHSSTASSSKDSHRLLVSDSLSLSQPSSTGSTLVTSVPTAASNRPLYTFINSACTQESWHDDLCNDVGESTCVTLSKKPLCSLAAADNCSRGGKCPHIHRELCPTCGKQWSRPFRPDEKEEHLRTCKKNKKRLEALKRGQEVECCVCLERILSKPTPAERKFGLLSECDHPFCISCIRNWRSSSPAIGMDVNTTLRACPICRKLSYFVIPSVIWYTTKEEKQEIVESYKAKLRSIDCKYFDSGNGICPFGTSCFYKHNVKLGSYTWNNLRPPPRCRSNTMDMADMLALLDEFEEYTEMDDVLDEFDTEDLENEVLTPEEIALLLMPLGLDTDEVLSHSEMAFLHVQLGFSDTDYSSGGE